MPGRVAHPLRLLQRVGFSMWDLDLSLVAPNPRRFSGKETPRDRQSGMPTLCKERKGWATRACAGLRVGHPRRGALADYRNGEWSSRAAGCSHCDEDAGLIRILSARKAYPPGTEHLCARRLAKGK
jgi:hypothetical protein